MTSARSPAAGLLLMIVVIVVGLGGCGNDDQVARQDSMKACAPDKDLDEGDSTVNLTVDGKQRTFLLHVPKSYDGSNRTPVVLMFHGLGSNGLAMVKTSQMDAESDRRGFLLVAPQARGEISRWDYKSPASTKGSDLAFVEAIVEDVRERACVDDDRVYASGFSNGALLTLALACSGDMNFAAFGAVSGPVDASRCSEAPPRAIAYFHGTNDTVVPFGGAKTVLGTFPPVPSTMKSWAEHDRCRTTPVVEVVSKTVQKFDWQGCDAGGELQSYAVLGGGHRWPGGLDTTSGRDAGALTQSIDATQLIWKFFAAHPKGEE